MKSSKIRLALLVSLVLVLAGLSVWALKIAPVAASSVAGIQSKGPTSQTKAQADVVATGLVFKQAVAAYQANPTPEKAAAVETARTAYDQAIDVRVAEISDRLAQLFPKASFAHADYGKKPEGPPARPPSEAVALLTELRSYDPPVSVQNTQLACPTSQTITQSSSQVITPGSSVSCNNGIGHTDNSYWRAFTLPTFGIVSQFNVSSVQIGVEKADAPSGSQSITVRLYRTTSGVFPTGTKNMLSSTYFNVTNQSGTIINVPIAANVPAGSELIVEVFTPNGQAGGNLFFIGSNAAAESGPSYISAASCDVTNPTPTAAINFPNDVVLNVVGCQQVEGAGSIIVSAGATLVSESCTPANGAIDPGETVTVSFCVQNTGNVNTTSLVGTLQATGGVTSPSGPQNYGVVVAGGPAVCRNFTFTATGSCGGTLTATIQMQDGATNLGNVTYTFTFGTQAGGFSENFDGVSVPNLPVGWVSAFTNGDGDCTIGGPLCTLGSNWTTVNTAPVDTAPNAAFHNDPSCVTDNTLDTPNINITTTSAQVTFRNNFNLESTFDGGVLEVSSPNINAGAFTDITNAAVGGSFVVGGYNGTISVNFLSPIAGRAAWTGNSAGFITTTANLGSNVAGQTIKLRFRFASDCSVSGTAWRIDTIRVTNGFTCCSSATPCVLTCPANITKSNDPNQCGAVVIYPAPTTTGTCGTVTCSPASGSFFPVGTTTVTCSSSAGAAPEGVGVGASFDVPDGSKAPAGGSSSGGIGSKGGTTAGTGGGIIAGATPTTSNSGGGVPKGSPGSSPKSPFAILYDQNNNPAPVPGGVTSQNFETAFDAFDTQAADDFVVPAGQTWTVQQVFVVGEYGNGPGPATSANVAFFSDAGTLPGAAVYTATNQPIVDVAADFTITLTVPAVLTAGTYWVSVQANENFTPAGQWFWDNRLTISNSGAAWRNPGGGFAVGCTAFGRKTTCLSTQNGPDQLFQILGTSAVAGGGPTCTFTVTVNDTQPPTITCPANVTAVTDQNCTAAACQTVTFPAPVATDNCPGVTVVCNPPSGSCFPVGVTTVTCTATDASGNTATCSFTISTFDTALQDDSNPSIILLWNSLTGAYRFCCNGITFTGIGKSTIQGCVFTLQHDPSDRRVLGRVDKAVHAGTASLQAPAGTIRCVITDRNTLNDTNLAACQ